MTIALTLQIRRLASAQGLALPAYMTPGAAGMDLYAALLEDVLIQPGDIVLVPTGLEVAIPDGFEGQVRPRSGLAVKHGISQALAKFEPNLRVQVKAAGFLTRDSRVVERKKYGRAKARRSFQFSKR